MEEKPAAVPPEEGPVTIPPEETRPCPSCRGAVPLNANFCPLCGYNTQGAPYTTTTAPPGAQAPYPGVTTSGAYPPPGTYPGYPAGYKPRTYRPTLGGVLVIIASILEILVGVGLLFAGAFFSSQINLPVGLGGALAAVGAVTLIFGIIALVGGALAAMRKMWPVAVVGGVVSILGGVMTGFIASVFGLIGLILIILAREEF